MRRIGIVLMSALGDVTLGLPVATAIRRTYPDARLTWIAQPGPDAIVARHPGVDEIVRFDRRAGVAAYPRIARELAGRRFDVLLDLQVALKAGLVTWCARAAEKWGVDRARSRDANWLFTSHRITARPRAHMADQFLEFLAPIGVPVTDDPDFGLVPCATCRDGADAILAPLDGAPFAAVIVASSAAHKNWDAARLGIVCAELAARHGLRVVLCGAGTPVERQAVTTIQRAFRGMPPNRHPVDALGSGIAPLLGILERASLVVSPDTGPLHLAVALRRPVIGLYGTTNPRWVGPYRWCHDLLVDRYGDPGEAYAPSAARRPGRMARIRVGDVLEKVAVWERDYRRATRAPVDALRGLRLASAASYTASVRTAV